MILAAHQPNFLPWLGFFDKMRKADAFVLVDHVQFERQNFQNRTRIKTGAGPRWITVPVLQRSRDERILDKAVDNSRDGRLRWGRKMFLTLKYAYQAAPHFADYEQTLAEILDARWERLIDLNERLIELCREELGIDTPILRSSSMEVSGSKSDMVLGLCKAAGADAYLAGAGASRGYLDEQAFKRAGVRIIWQDFRHPTYVQHPESGSFAERLSVVDLLVNCGPRSRMLLQRGEEAKPSVYRWNQNALSAQRLQPEGT